MGTYQNICNPGKLNIIYIEQESSCNSDEEVQEKKNRYKGKLNQQYYGNTIFQTESEDLNNFTGAEQPYEVPKLPEKHPWLPNRYQDMLIQWYLKSQKKNCACSQLDETLNQPHLMKQRVHDHEIPSDRLLRIDAQFDSYNETQMNWPAQTRINENYVCLPKVWKQSEKCCRQGVQRIPKKVCQCFYPPPHKSKTCWENVQRHKSTSTPCYCNSRKARNESNCTQTCEMSRTLSEPSTIEIESETCSETIEGESSKVNLPEGNIFAKRRFWQFLGVDGLPLPIGMLKSKKSKVEVWVRVEPSDSGESVTYQHDEDNVSPNVEDMGEAPKTLETNTEANTFVLNIHLQDSSQDIDEISEQTVLEAPVNSPVDTSTKWCAVTPEYSGETYRRLTRVILEPDDTSVFMAPQYPPASQRLSASVQYQPYELPHFECPHYPLDTIDEEHRDSFEPPFEQPSLVGSILSATETVEEQPSREIPSLYISSFSIKSEKESSHISSLSIKPEEVSPHISSLSINPEKVSPHISSLSIKSEKVSPHISSLSINPEKVSPHISSLSIKSEEVSPHISSLSIKSEKESLHISSLSIKPEKVSPHTSSLSINPEKVSPHISSLSINPEKVSPHISSLSINPEKVSPHISSLSINPEKVSPHISSLSIKSEKVSPHISSLSIKPGEASPHISSLSIKPEEVSKPISTWSMNLEPTPEESNEEMYSRLVETTSLPLPEVWSLKDPSNDNNTLTSEEQETTATDKFIAMFGTPWLQQFNKEDEQQTPGSSHHTIELKEVPSRHESYHTRDLSQFDPYVKEVPSVAPALNQTRSQPQGYEHKKESKPSWIPSPTPALAKHRSPSSFPPPDNASPFWNSLCKCEAQKGTHDDEKDNGLERYSPLLYAPYPQQINITAAVPPESYPVHPTCSAQFKEPPTSPIRGDMPSCKQYTHNKISIYSPQNIRIETMSKDDQTNGKCLGTNQSSHHSEIKEIKICPLYSTDKDRPSNLITSESAPIISLKGCMCSSEQPVLLLPTAIQETIHSFEVQPPSNTNQTCICHKQKLPNSHEETPLRIVSVRKSTTRSPSKTCNCKKPKLPSKTPMENKVQSSPTQLPKKTCICNKPEPSHSVLDKPIQNFSDRTATNHPLNKTCSCNKPGSPCLVLDKPTQNFSDRTATNHLLNKICSCNKPESPCLVLDKPTQNFSDRTATIPPLDKTCSCNKPESPCLVLDKSTQTFSDRTATITPLNKTCSCNKPESPCLVLDKPTQNFSDRTATIPPLNKICSCNKPESPCLVLDKPTQNFSDRTATIPPLNKICSCNKPESPCLVLDKPTQNFSDRTATIPPLNKICSCNKPESPCLVLDKPTQNFSDRTATNHPLNKTCSCNKPELPCLVLDKPTQNFSDRTATIPPLNKICSCNKPESPCLILDKPTQNFSDRTATVQPLNKICSCNKPESPCLVLDKPTQNFSDRTATILPPNKTCTCNNPASPPLVLNEPTQNFSKKTVPNHSPNNTCICNKPELPRSVMDKPNKQFNYRTSNTQPPSMFHEKCGCDNSPSSSPAVKNTIQTFGERILTTWSPNLNDRFIVQKHIYLESEKQNQSTAIASTQTDNNAESCMSTKFCSTQTSFIYTSPLEENNYSTEPLKLTSTKLAENSLVEEKTAKSSCKQTISTKAVVWPTSNIKFKSIIRATRSCENLPCKYSTRESRTMPLASYDTANVRVLETTELGITSSSTPLHSQVAIKLRVGTPLSTDIPECESLDFVQPYPHTCTLHETQKQDTSLVGQIIGVMPDLQTDEKQTTLNDPVCVCKSSKPKPSINIVPCIAHTCQAQESNQNNYKLISNQPPLKLTESDAPLLLEITDKQTLYYSAIHFNDDEEEIFCELLSSSSQSEQFNKTESWTDLSPSPSSIGEQFDKPSIQNQSLPLTSEKEAENEESASMSKTDEITTSVDEHIWEGMSSKSSVNHSKVVHYAADTLPEQDHASVKDNLSVTRPMFQLEDPCFQEIYPTIFTTHSPCNDLHDIKHVPASPLNTKDPCFKETLPHMNAQVRYKPNVSETDDSVPSRATAKLTKSLPITQAEKKDPCFQEPPLDTPLSSRPSIYYSHIPAMPSSSHQLMNIVEETKPLPVVNSSRPSIYFSHIPAMPSSSHELMNIVEDTKPLPVVNSSRPSIYFSHIPAMPSSSHELMNIVEDTKPLPVVNSSRPSIYFSHIPAMPSSSHELMNIVEDTKPLPVVNSSRPSIYYTHIPAIPSSSHELMNIVEDTKLLPIDENSIMPREAIKSSHSVYYAALPYKWASSSESGTSGPSSETKSVRYKSACDVLDVGNLNAPVNEIGRETALMSSGSDQRNASTQIEDYPLSKRTVEDASMPVVCKTENKFNDHNHNDLKADKKQPNNLNRNKK